MRINMNMGKWSYQIEQDTETGALEILKVEPFAGFKRAVEYAKTEVSNALSEPLRLPVIEARKAACFGCEALEQDGENMYCKACGCPKWERSRLQVKWEMPAAKCNLGKWPE